MKLDFDVVAKKKVRVLIDTDAACEADDPFAIVHALMSPKLLVKGILAEQFGTVRNHDSTRESYDEILRITEAMGVDVPIHMGAKAAMVSKTSYALSEATQAIIDEALADDPAPLFVLCMGALTNVAVALTTRPEIAGRLTIVSIGGQSYDANFFRFREFNFGNDILAANIVMETPVAFWQIPADVYTTMRVGLAELQKKVKPMGKIGQHLFEQMVAYNATEWAFWTMGESWSLGDSPAVGVTIYPGCGRFIERQASIINEDTSYSHNPNGRMIRVYQSIDSRFILEDFFAKLALRYGPEA